MRDYKKLIEMTWARTGDFLVLEDKIHHHFLDILRDIFVDDNVIDYQVHSHSFIPDYVIEHNGAEEIDCFIRYSSEDEEYVRKRSRDLHSRYSPKPGRKKRAKLFIILMKGDNHSPEIFKEYNNTLIVSAECLDAIDNVIYGKPIDVARHVSYQFKSLTGYFNTKQIDVLLNCSPAFPTNLVRNIV